MIKDPTEWMDDFTVHLDDDAIAEQAAALEPTLVDAGPKVAAAIWLSVVAALAGAFGGVTLSADVRRSTLIFIAYLVGGGLLLRLLHPVTVRLTSRPMAWQAAFTFFFSFLLAVVAVQGGRVGSTMVAYIISIGGGFFIGMMYGAFPPGVVKREDVWMMVAFPLAPAATGLATALHRGTLESSSSIAATALVGTVAAVCLFTPMAVSMALLWKESHGLERMAKLYLHNDNFAGRAVSYLDRAIAISPKDADLYNLRGIAYSKMGESARAAADWQKVIELEPNAGASHMNRGVDHLRHGSVDAAVESLLAAVRLEPNDAKAHSNLGAAYAKRGDLALAIEHYDRAIALVPTYGNAYSNRGFALFKMGEYQRALADCDRAVKLEPERAMAWVNRGHALAALGNKHEAAVSYRQAVDLDAEPDIVEEALEGLAKLGAESSEGSEA